MVFLDFEAGDLRIEDNNYYVQNKKKFIKYAQIMDSDKKECFDFAYDMSYGKIGEHRDSRSGGLIHRKKGQIFINTFQGKMAEFGLYRFLISKNIKVEKPDTSRYELGQWDSFDIDCQGKHISVKSTKYYGDLLLLEKKDWNNEGEYKPNIGKENAKYDYTVLVRFSPDGEKVMRQNRLLFQNDNEIATNIRDILIEKIYNQKWNYDIPGFIYYSELVKMIRDRRIIPQNAMLNGTTKMDAENYYFQTGNMHSIVEVYMPKSIEEQKERKNNRLIRTCPLCGDALVMKKGYSMFWGCAGYFKKQHCEYKEKIDK